MEEFLDSFRVFNGNMEGFNNFMDIYCYNMGIRRSLNVFTAFIMEIWRILNGFTAFNGNMEDIKRVYGF
jgi:hypothetical protein